MSLRPMLWALYEAPVSELPAGALRVLLMLADHASDDEGRGAWPSVPTIADRLDMSERSVQRHFRTLQDARLIRRGDQRFTDHMRGDRRPVVWDLIMTPDPVDNPVTPSRHGVTPAVANGVTPAVADGVTPAVAQGTRIEPPIEPPGAGGHPHESNARRALAALATGIDVEDLVRLAYAGGDGDPWSGYLRIKAESETLGGPGIRDRAAVLRSRLALTSAGAR